MKTDEPSRAGPDALALVIPVFNEAALVAHALPQIEQAARAAAPGCDVTLVVVDDGSTDGTRAALDRLAQTHPALHAIGFTRNFGKEAAIHAGLRHALDATPAQALVVIDADLQHPPALIATMVERWREGYDVVEAVKRHRGDESAARRLAARLFYGVFSKFSGLRLDEDTDFKLLDRSVAQALLQMDERVRFFRGLIRWMGFTSARLEFDVAPRAAGGTGWSVPGLARYAWRNLTSFSSAPLRIVALLGGVGLVVGVALAIKTLADKFQGRGLDGFTTVILVQIIFGSLILISLGVIGSYIARIYDELKARPHYVLRPPARDPAGQEPRP
jgi:glycosyltransferase involved in cell wall biosynthesis